MKHLLFHDCSRFMIRKMTCPFRGLEEDPEEEDKQPVREREQPEQAEEEREGVRIPIALPGRNRRKRHERSSERPLENPLELPLLAVAKGEVREALERMRQLQFDGGLPSLPNIQDLAFPSLGQGHQQIIAVLTAIAIAAALKSSRGFQLGNTFQGVQLSERRVSKGLSKLSDTSQLRGRGGFHRNAAADLRELLGFRRRKLGGPVGGFDSFSETGFP